MDGTLNFGDLMVITLNKRYKCGHVPFYINYILIVENIYLYSYYTYWEYNYVHIILIENIIMYTLYLWRIYVHKYNIIIDIYILNWILIILLTIRL